MNSIPFFGTHISEGIRNAWASPSWWEKADAVLTVGIVYVLLAYTIISTIKSFI